MTRHPTFLAAAVITWNLLALAAPAHSQTQADPAPILRTITRQYHNHSYYTRTVLIRETLSSPDGSQFTETVHTYRLKDTSTSAEVTVDADTSPDSLAGTPATSPSGEAGVRP